MLERDDSQLDGVVDWVVVVVGVGEAACWVGDFELALRCVGWDLEFDELERMGWVGC